MATWTFPALVLSWAVVITHANVTYTGSPEEECGRSKFCQSDCECRSVDKGGKGVIKECVRRDILDKTTLPTLCGHSGLPAVKITVRNRGRRRITVASAVKHKAKKCPMQKLIPVKRICCSHTDKPGQCPFFLAKEQQCGQPCDADNDCTGDLKCCHTNCDPGQKRCVSPLPKVSCQEKFCGPYFTCRDKLNGARCCREKGGECPSQNNVMCSSSTKHDSCLTCSSDEECTSNRKCCPCNDCIQCLRPGSFPSLCQRVNCTAPADPQCVENKGACFTSPCPTVATCRPQGSNPGQCPTVSDQEESPCRHKECRTDSDCGSGQLKCCPSPCPHRKRCVRSLPLSSCQGVICPEGRACYEVFRKGSGSAEDAVTPLCLEQKPVMGNACGGKAPPLLLWLSGRELVVLQCGGPFSPLTCPPRYSCTPHSDRPSLCCPRDKPPCNPPCLDSQKCDVGFNPGCESKPCVFSKCVTKNTCLLPKVADDGYCTNKAEQVQKYYFDNKEYKCKPFGYNCGGNANRFHTLQACQDQCETTKDPTICLLPKHPGLCWSGFSRRVVFYFNQNSLQCLSMPDASCGLKDRNANNFPSMADCLTHCQGKFQCPPVPPEAQCRNVVDRCRVKDEDEVLLPVCPPGKSCCDTACGKRCVVPVPS